MKRPWVILLVPLMVLAIIASLPKPDSASGQLKNIEFMTNVLGPVVLEYMDKTGDAPEGFEIALNEYDGKLPNRGDYYGRSLVYEKKARQSFRFVAYGRNGEYDGGFGDDVVAEYLDGSWTNNLKR